MCRYMHGFVLECAYLRLAREALAFFWHPLSRQGGQVDWECFGADDTAVGSHVLTPHKHVQWQWLFVVRA